MANNIYTMTVGELLKAYKRNVQCIADAEQTIAKGTLDARNTKNFKRFISRTTQINDIIEARIAKLGTGAANA